MSPRRTDLNVVVTAGASGIGRAIAKEFHKVGARLAVCDIDRVAIETLRREMPSVHAAVVDVAIKSEVEAFIGDVLRRYGTIQVAINNAGIAGACRPLEELSEEDLVHSFAVNVHAAFHVTAAVVPAMKTAGGGAIVNISTCSTATLPVGRADYIASKWALEGLTRASARELGPHNIRVNAIRPGMVNNLRMQHILGKIADDEGIPLEAVELKFLDYISLRAKVEPHEIGQMAVYLASPAAAHVSGQIIAVDGNMEWEM